MFSYSNQDEPNFRLSEWILGVIFPHITPIIFFFSGNSFQPWRRSVHVSHQARPGAGGQTNLLAGESFQDQTAKH